jgi:hypothetical protein
MSGQEAIIASISDALPPSLQFKPSPGASWCLDRRQTRWHVQGSDTYSPQLGRPSFALENFGRALRMAGPWLRALPIRFYSERRQHAARCKCTMPFSRLTIRCNNSLVEDIQNYHVSYSVFEKALTRAWVSPWLLYLPTEKQCTRK